MGEPRSPAARRSGAAHRSGDLKVAATTRRHAVYRLAPDLLLVFKPRGHREAEHAHPRRQRLRVLRGRLQVEMARRRVTLTPASSALTLPAARPHATLALADTWLIAERLPARRSSAALRGH